MEKTVNKENAKLPETETTLFKEASAKTLDERRHTNISNSKTSNKRQ